MFRLFISFKKDLFYVLHALSSLCACVRACACTHGEQKKALDPLQLEYADTRNQTLVL